MSAPGPLATPRLRLRQWSAADRAPFAALNADPEVMHHFPAPLTRAQSDAMADRIEALIHANGWGLWAADWLADGAPRFMGFVGLNAPTATLPFNPCVEIGWRLARPFWGRGLATEAARLALRAGFETLALPEIVSFTVLGNQRSRAVMQRLGMRECPHEAFEHPSVPPGHPLRAHCLYRLPRAGWQG
ncbi:MAG: GNAT family N-acetyltransferase [Comamonadaceae bacterium]|nr:GNAT family N-acetyltransferase [Comamonadaceae bacterium]